MNDEWITNADVVEIVRTYLGCSCSTGRAQKVTKDALASGEVRIRHPFVINDDGIVADPSRNIVIGVELFNKNDLLDWLSRQQFLDQKPASKPAPGGRPPEYDLLEIKLFFEQLLKERGDPTDEKDQRRGWKSLADAMKVIRDHMDKQGQLVPDKTRFYEILNEVLSDYRRGLADASAN